MLNVRKASIRCTSHQAISCACACSQSAICPHTIFMYDQHIRLWVPSTAIPIACKEMSN
jgi:hypothetical protein